MAPKKKPEPKSKAKAAPKAASPKAAGKASPAKAKPSPKSARGSARSRSPPRHAASPPARVTSPTKSQESPEKSSPTGNHAPSPTASTTLAVIPTPSSLKVRYDCRAFKRTSVGQAPQGQTVVNKDAAVLLCEGLARLRKSSSTVGGSCDVGLVFTSPWGSGDTNRLPVHSAVIALQSTALERRLVAGEKPDLVVTARACPEAVEWVARWFYVELDAKSYRPSSQSVNESVLRIAAELEMPGLSELCASFFASSADSTNIITIVCLCEELGLRRLRKDLLISLTENKTALHAVSSSPMMFAQPALMRELLARLSGTWQEEEEE